MQTQRILAALPKPATSVSRRYQCSLKKLEGSLGVVLVERANKRVALTEAGRRNDDYTQAGDLFRLVVDNRKEQLFENIAGALEGVPEEITRRQLAHFTKADPAYGEGVSKRLGVS